MKEFIKFIIIEGSIVVSLYFIATFIVMFLNQLSSSNFQDKLKSSSLGYGNILSAFFGSITPFCSCTTVPILEGMLRSGIRFGIAFTFLIASPLVNEIVILIMARSFGLIFTVSFIIIALSVAIFAGIFIDKIGFAKLLRNTFKNSKPVEGFIESEQNSKISRKSKLSFSLIISWSELKKTLPYIGIGLLIGGGIYGFIPEGLIISLNTMFSPVLLIVILAFLGTPLYFNMISALPIAIALLDKGLTIGPIVAFLIAGAGTSITELILLWKIFKAPLQIAYAAVMIGSAILIGLLFNYMSLLIKI